MFVRRILSSPMKRINFIQSNQRIDICMNNVPKRRFQLMVSLFQKTKQDMLQNEVLYGRSVCNIALKVSRRPVFRLHVLNKWGLVMPEDERVAEALRIAAQRNIPVSHTNRKQLDSMVCHRPHQGVCMEVGELPFMDFNKTSCKSLVKSADHDGHRIWLLLHGILDPMNLGAILRSCYFFNVNGVIVSGNCSPLTPVVSKASSGAAEIMQVYSTEDPEEIVQEMLNDNWEVIGTVVEPGDSKCSKVEDVSKVTLKSSTLLIFGSEGDGLPQPILDRCTRHVTIGTNPNHLIKSLNVSTACAVILHSFMSSVTDHSSEC